MLRRFTIPPNLTMGGKPLLATAHLRWQTILIISLWNLGQSLDEMMETLEVKPRKRRAMQSLLDQILASDNPVLVAALRVGLPATASTCLPDGVTVQCEKCRGSLNMLPCVVCSQGIEEVSAPEIEHYRKLRAMRNDIIDGDVPLSDATRPTGFPPSSLGKIFTMRERVAAGESPFHPEDVTFENLTRCQDNH